MTPDAIFILSAGIKKDATGEYVPTDYSDRDAFGTLGGIERVRAAAVLAKQFPNAVLVTTSKTMTGEPPTHASIYANALSRLGVLENRILREEQSTTTGNGVAMALNLTHKRNWGHIAFLSNEYHLPRVRAFWEQIPGPKPHAEFVSAENILMEEDPSFNAIFNALKKTQAYQERLIAEARGIEAFALGTYRLVPPVDKFKH